MNDSRLIELFGDIDEKYIKEAIPSNKVYFISWLQLGAICATLILVSVLLVPHISKPNSVDELDTPLFSSDAPPHFYYHDSVYVCRGPYLDELPEGAVLIGAINNVGDTFSGIDFDGNSDGLIYMVPQDKSMAYVQIDKNGGGENAPHPYVAYQQEQIPR